MSTHDVSTDTEPDSLTKREVARTKAFWIAFEMIFVFGIPALLAVGVSRWLIARELAPGWVLYAGLGLAFVISWVIVFVRVRRLGQELDRSNSDQS